MSVFFYDSYAVIEYLNDNPLFRSYFEEHTGILTLLNLLEIYYSVLQETGEEKAKEVLEILQPLTVHPSKESIQKAMKFRLHNKKHDLSSADCLGYQIAADRGIKFLTGDKEFKNIENVEFVK